MNIANRTIELDYRQASKNRTVPIVVSSEKPVERDGYLEVLRHAEDAIDLEREPLPLIESHNGNQVNIGLVEGLRVAGGKLRGTARFGKSSRANELWPDVEAGIVRNISVGYQVLDFAEDNDTSPPTLTATRWKPFECSIVSIPADENCGFYRNYLQDKTMTEPNKETLKLPRSERRSEHAGVEAERERVNQILAMAQRHDVEELGRKAIEDGLSSSSFNSMALNVIGERNAAAKVYAEDSGDGFGSPKGKRESSSIDVSNFYRGNLINSFHGFLACAAGVASDLDMGPYKERSQEISQRTGRKPKHGGVLFPLGDLHTRALTKGGQGSNIVDEVLLSGSFVDVLRAKSVIMNMGPTIIPSLIGDAVIPRKTSGTTDTGLIWMAATQSLNQISHSTRFLLT